MAFSTGRGHPDLLTRLTTSRAHVPTSFYAYGGGGGR